MNAIHWVPALFVLPLAAAALTPALFHGRPAGAWRFALGVAMATSGIALFVIVALPLAGEFRYPVGGWGTALGIELRFDALSAITVVFGVVTSLVLLFSKTLAADLTARPALYYALILVNLGGLNGFAVTNDLFNLFVFMELLSVSAYALVAAGRGKGAALAALKYLLPGAVSSLLVLFAIGLLLALTGSLNMQLVAERLPAAPAGAVALAATAFLVGFMVKAALFPLHFWLPDAHGAAPGPVSALLSGLVVKAGVIGLFRGVTVFDAPHALNGILMTLGAIAILAGGIAAMVQHELKRLLAYSTVAHLGYIVLGLGLATSASIAGSFAHMGYHALTKAGVFLAAAALVERTGLRDLDDLRGLGHRMPWSATALCAGLVALSGVPPTAGFVGKWQIALGAMSSDHPWVVLVVLVGALIALGYGIRVINALFFRAPTRAQVVSAREAPLSMVLPLVLLIGLALSAGLTGAWVVSFVQPLAEVIDAR